MKKRTREKEELIEEWDWEKAVPTGRPVARKKAHLEGIAHEGVHLWVIRTSGSAPELLFQRRAGHKDTYPDCLDITVGGHVPFGTADKKIQKESYEEIGIAPPDSEMSDLGYFRYEEKAGGLFHREFQRVYLYMDNRPLNEYRFNDSEVTAICAVFLPDIEQLLTGDLKISAEVYDGKKTFRTKFNRIDFHPLLFSHIMAKYMRVVIKGAIEIFNNDKVTARMPPPV
ncbi:MAG: hypothetical protein MUC95_07640 [Spirochaetes bacterium]|nr:hypothetical protein [Spirochaetota bacterium]